MSVDNIALQSCYPPPQRETHGLNRTPKLVQQLLFTTDRTDVIEAIKDARCGILELTVLFWQTLLLVGWRYPSATNVRFTNYIYQQPPNGTCSTLISLVGISTRSLLKNVPSDPTSIPLSPTQVWTSHHNFLYVLVQHSLHVCDSHAICEAS